MRSRLTWVVVAALCGLLLAAVVDAVRGDGSGGRGREPAPFAESARVSAPPASSEREAAAAGLQAAGVTGKLLWTDAACGVHTLILPSLESGDVSTGGCTLAVSREGAVSYAGDAIAPSSDVAARCREGMVELVDAGRDEIRDRFRGCGPSWRPDGELGFVLDGSVALREPVCPSAGGRPCTRVLLSRAALARIFEREPWLLAGPVIEEFAWLDRERFAAVVADHESGEEVVGIFRGDRLLGAPPFAYEALSHLRASPLGRYVAARLSLEQGLLVLDRQGEFVPIDLRSGRAIAWSPDESWAAIARFDGTYLFRTAERTPTLIRVPIDARDVFWLPTSES